jgi:hypothetical protein
MCRGEYFGNSTRLTLHPGTESKLPDEVAITMKTVAQCSGCKESIDRTRGAKNKKKLRPR